MNLNLPNEMNDFVQGLVSHGRFESEEDAVVEGIRLLMARESLRGEIKKGIDQLESGRWLDEDAVFDELNSEIDRIESSPQGS